jgi:predicted DNA-binding transcriptional regulator YafY
MNLERIQRLLQLIGLLQAGRGCNTDALAQACAVSRRTIFRDLDLLHLSGIPLQFDAVLQPPELVRGGPVLDPPRQANIQARPDRPNRNARRSFRDPARLFGRALPSQRLAHNPQKGRDRQVVVRFSPLVAQNVAEVNRHKTQQIEFSKDRSADFHATVLGLNEISWWILGYGDQAESLEPPELRRLIADRVKRMAEKYG